MRSPCDRLPDPRHRRNCPPCTRRHRSRGPPARLTAQLMPALAGRPTSSSVNRRAPWRPGRVTERPLHGGVRWSSSDRSSHAKQALGAGRGQRRSARGALDRHRSALQRSPCARRRPAHPAGQGKPDRNSSVSATQTAANRYEKAHAAFTKRDPKCRRWERPHPRRIASPARKRRRQTLRPPLANARASCYPLRYG